MFLSFAHFFCFAFIVGCGGAAPVAPIADTTDEQMIELKVNGTKKTADPSAIITAAYSLQHLVLGYLSESDDLSFALSAYLPELKAGTYSVYTCRSASTCTEATPDQNQSLLLSPYPKDPMPAVSLSRSAYVAPDLGLQPVQLTITSITEEQQAGSPLKTRRVKGSLSGVLAYVEQVTGGYQYKVVGNTTSVQGSFDVFCRME